MKYIYDLIIVVILVAGVYTGTKKGIIRSVVGICCSAAAFAAAALTATDTMAERVYDKYVHNEVQKLISEGLDEVRERTQNAIDDYVDKKLKEIFGTEEKGDDEKDKGVDIISDIIRKMEKGISDSDTEEMTEYVSLAFENVSVPEEYRSSLVTRILSDRSVVDLVIENVLGISGREEINNYIEKTYIRPRLIRIIAALSWGIIFGGVKLLLWLITGSIMRLLKSSRELRTADSIAGGVIGFAGSGVLCAASAFAVFLIVSATGGTRYFNEDVISETLVFRAFYTAVSNLTF